MIIHVYVDERLFTSFEYHTFKGVSKRQIRHEIMQKVHDELRGNKERLAGMELYITDDEYTAVAEYRCFEGNRRRSWRWLYN